VTNISKSFTDKMAAKINWYRYRTKLRHCHPVYILFEKYIYILALEMARPGNQHCANCVGTLLLPMHAMRPKTQQPRRHDVTVLSPIIEIRHASKRAERANWDLAPALMTNCSA